MHSAKLLLPSLASLLLLGNSQAALLFYEGFDYPKGEELGETALSNPSWENDKSQFTVKSGSLDYPGLKASTGNRLNVTSTAPSTDSVRTVSGAWPAQSSGALFLSFLLRIESADGIESTGDGTSVLTLGKAANNSHLLGINLLNDGGIKLGVVKYASGSARVSSAFFSSGIATNLSATGSTVYLVVAKYEWADGPENDVVTVWVNPQTLGGSEDPANNVSTSAGTDGTQPAGRLTLSRGPEVNLDEIRLGQTWAEVTPPSGAQQLVARPQSETP